MLCALPVGECGDDALGVPRRALDHLVVVVRNADEHPEVGAFFKIEHQARVFDRLPRRLEEQPVLRIDVGRFARRDAEKLRIELVDAIDEAAAPGDGLAGQCPAPHHKSVRRSTDPAARRRRLAAFDQKFPERIPGR